MLQLAAAAEITSNLVLQKCSARWHALAFLSPRYGHSCQELGLDPVGKLAAALGSSAVGAAVTTFIAAAPVDRMYRHRFTGDRLRRIQPNGIGTRCWCTLTHHLIRTELWSCTAHLLILWCICGKVRGVPSTAVIIFWPWKVTAPQPKI